MIYAAETGGGTLSNPVSTAQGRIPGWLEVGSYNITISGSGITTYTRALEIVRGDAVFVPDGSITTAKLANDAVTTLKIDDDAVTNPKLGNASVNTLKLGDESVTIAKLDPAAVTTLQGTADGSITTAKLANDAVTTLKIDDDAVTAPKIANDAVGTSEIAGSSVGTDELINDSVTGDKLAPEAVQLEHLADTAMPVGAILLFAGPTAPAGWRICNGVALIRNDFPDLWTRIQTTYGVGNGTTTFNIPDLQGRFPVGVGTNVDVNALGKNEGFTTVSNRRPKHRHSRGSLSINNGGSHRHHHSNPAHSWYGMTEGQAINLQSGLNHVIYRFFGNEYTDYAGDHGHGTTGEIGDTTGPLDSPPYIALHYIIRVE